MVKVSFCPSSQRHEKEEARTWGEGHIEKEPLKVEAEAEEVGAVAVSVDGEDDEDGAVVAVAGGGIGYILVMEIDGVLLWEEGVSK